MTGEISASAPPSQRLRVALVTRDPEGRILLLNHVRPHASYWVLPGGGVNPGEELADALRREVLEELLVGCHIEDLIAVGEFITRQVSPPRHIVDFFFTGTLESTEGFVIPADEGIAEARWVDPSDFDELMILPQEIIPVLRWAATGDTVRFIHLGKYKIAP